MRTPESIPLYPLGDNSKSDIDPETRIKEIVKIYENSNETFATLGYQDLSENVFIRNIFNKIREILILDLNIEIETLFQIDYHSFNMILSTFFGLKHALNIPKISNENTKKFEEKDFLPDCKQPLHTVVVMCYVSHKMKKLFEKGGFGVELEQEKYEKLKEYYQDVACNLVKHLYGLKRKGPEMVRAALQADYNSKRNCEKLNHHKKYSNKKRNQSIEIMGIAYKAEAMKFLTQKPCLNLIKIRYKGKDRVKKPCEGAYIVQKIHAIVDWRPSMYIKLSFHAILRFLYILAFAKMLCSYPIYDDYDRLDKRSWTDFIPMAYVLSVLLAQLLMIFIKIYDFIMLKWSTKLSKTGIKKFCFLFIHFFKCNHLACLRLTFIVPLLILEALRAFLSAMKLGGVKNGFYNGFLSIIPILLEFLYCFLFMVTTLSSLRFFYSFQSLGFFMHMIKKTLKTVGMFFSIFIAFWFVLAVTHVSISRVFVSSNNTIFHTVLSVGKFEIFGEVQDEDRLGKLSGCSNYTRNIFDIGSMDYDEASCLFRTSIIPILVFIYIFLAGILLVNLLTAQLTKEYEKESENSRYYEGYLRYEQLVKIESKIYLPPPLSFIYVVLRVFFSIISLFIWIAKKIYQCYRYLRQYCRQSNRETAEEIEEVPSDDGGFWCDSYYYRLIRKYTIGKFEGDPYQAVREYKDKNQTEIKIQKFLRKSTNGPWIKMKDSILNLIDECGKTTIDLENLNTVQRKINELFDDEKTAETERRNLDSRIGNNSDDDPTEECNIP